MVLRRIESCARICESALGQGEREGVGGCGEWVAEDVQHLVGEWVPQHKKSPGKAEAKARA